MAQFTPTGRVLPHELLDRLKWEVAAQEGLTAQVLQNGWPNMTSHDCGRVGGRIGGRMVKVMIQQAEEALKGGADSHW
ncbi:MAG: small, acid-soluble spore protein, alpha/beta type [Mycobacterium leprae]